MMRVGEQAHGLAFWRAASICLSTLLFLLWSKFVLLSFAEYFEQLSASDNLAAIISDRERVPVFYNLFVKDEEDAPRVREIVMEQFSKLLPIHDVYLHSIGVPLHNLSVTKTLDHHAQGTEMITLHSLWEYCKQHTDDKVVYLHSKGSFSPSSQNDRYRRFNTVGALSQECLHLPTTCNVCSSRMSPIPNAHPPGNMWLARCEYISQLIDPNLFTSKMDLVQRRDDGSPPYCTGHDRFAAEHWVLSHPAARPCDLSDDPKYLWGAGETLPGHDFEKVLSAAPRFPLHTYIPQRSRCMSERGEMTGADLKEVIAKYFVLYEEVPSQTWWGWRLYLT